MAAVRARPRPVPTSRTSSGARGGSKDPVDSIVEGIIKRRSERMEKAVEEAAKGETPAWARALTAVTQPLDVLQVPQRTIASTLQELKDAATGKGFSPQDLYDQANPFHAFTGKGDPTFGMGRVIPDVTFDDSLGNVFDKAVGFTADVATDPLTYATFGVVPVAGKTARAARLGTLLNAQRKAADAAESAKAFKALGFVEDAAPAAARTVREPDKVDDLFRALGFGTDEALDATPVNQLPDTLRGATQRAEQLGGPEALNRLGQRGLGVANPAQSEAMGLLDHGLKFRVPFTQGRRTPVVPGTRKIGEKLNEGFGAVRGPLRSLPGAETLRHTRSPTGFLGDDLHPAYERVITGKGPMGIEEALDVIQINELLRVGGGGFAGQAAGEVDRLAKELKGMSEEEIKALRIAAEVNGEQNILTETAQRMVQAAKNLGVDLPTIEGGNYAMPHVLNRDFRNVLRAAFEGGDTRAKAFMNEAGLRSEDLLEGSGFLQRRHFRPMNGQPYVLRIGDKKIEIATDSVDELNDKLKVLFPEFEGDIYVTNPVAAYRMYVEGMSKDVAERFGFREGARQGIPGLMEDPGKPKPYDPVTNRPTQAGIDESVVSTAPAPTGNALWDLKPDEDLTKARNADIVDRHTKLVEQYDLAGEAQRRIIAEQIDEVSSELLGEMRGVRNEQWAAQTAARTRAAQAAGDFNEITALRGELGQAIDETTDEIARLAKVRYGIERTARNRTAGRQRAMLKELQDRHAALVAERTRILDNYHTMMANFDAAVEPAVRNVRAAARAQAEQIAGRPNKMLQAYKEARRKAENQLRIQNAEGKHPRVPTRKEAKAAARYLKDNQAAFAKWIDETERFKAAQRLADDYRTFRDLERRAISSNEYLSQVEEGMLGRFAKRDAAGEFAGMRQRGIVELGSEAPEVYTSDAIENMRKRLNTGKFKEIGEAIDTLDLRRQADETIDKLTSAPRSRLGDARMDKAGLVPPSAAKPEEVVEEAATKLSGRQQSRLDAANRLLSSNQANELNVEQSILDTLRRQSPDTKAAKSRLAKEIRTQEEKVEKLAGKTSRGKRLDERVAEARRTVDQLGPKPETPPATRPPVESRDPRVRAEAKVERMPKEGQARITNQTNEQLAANAEELGDVKGRLGRIAAGSDSEYNQIPLDEGTQAIEARRAVSDQQERLRVERAEYQAKVDDLDNQAGGIRETYLEAMRDQEAARAEHQRIQNELVNHPVRKATKSDPDDLLARPVNKSQTGKKDLEGVRRGDLEPEEVQPLSRVVEDIKQLVEANPTGDDTLLYRAEAALHPIERQLADLTTETDLPRAAVNDILGAARRGELGEVLVPMLKDDWRAVWEGGDVYIQEELRKRFTRFVEGVTKDPQTFGRLLTAYTNFFKTYATLTPGFHIRNGMSAVFMNFTDDVAPSAQLRGLKIWREFSKSDSPSAHIARLQAGSAADRQAADALLAAMGSGAGGRFFESGVADATRATGFGRFSERVFSNRATVASQKFGQDLVEGPVRTAMAIDAIEKGGSVTEAIQRISRIQFDYSQTSQFDERMKRIFPFWTFMSRNLPMQITQMWTKPRVYSQYKHFVENFSQPNPEGTPEYFGDIGAFYVGELGDIPIFLQPDFAHNRLGEEVSKIEDISKLEFSRLLGDVNPMFTAPAEFATGKNFFTGRTYDETDVREMGGVEKLLGGELLAKLFRQTQETPGGKTVVNEPFIEMLYSLNPLMERGRRLAPQAYTGGNDDMVFRQMENILRTGGAPVRSLSPGQKQSTMRAQYYDQRDEDAMRRALARIDAGG